VASSSTLPSIYTAFRYDVDFRKIVGEGIRRLIGVVRVVNPTPQRVVQRFVLYSNMLSLQLIVADSDFVRWTCPVLRDNGVHQPLMEGDRGKVKRLVARGQR